MFGRIFKWLFFSCSHKWKIYREQELYRTNRYPESGPIGIAYVLQCEKCGDLKSRKVWAADFRRDS